MRGIDEQQKNEKQCSKDSAGLIEELQGRRERSQRVDGRAATATWGRRELACVATRGDAGAREGACLSRAVCC